MNNKLYDIHEYINKHEFKPVLKLKWNDKTIENRIISRCDCGAYCRDSDHRTREGVRLVLDGNPFISAVYRFLPNKYKKEYIKYLHKIDNVDKNKLKSDIKSWEKINDIRNH